MVVNLCSPVEPLAVLGLRGEDIHAYHAYQ